MRSKLGTLSRWFLLVSWGSAMLYLSLDPLPPVPKTGFLAWDKFQHAFAYGLLTFLGGIASPSVTPSFRRGWFAAAFLAVLYGCLIEAAQGFLTASRVAESGDIVADGVGAGVVLTVALLSKLIPSTSKS